MWGDVMEFQTRDLRDRRGADLFLDVGEDLRCPIRLAAGGVPSQEDELRLVTC